MVDFPAISYLYVRFMDERCSQRRFGRKVVGRSLLRLPASSGNFLLCFAWRSRVETPPPNVSCGMSPAKIWKCCKFRFKISRDIEETSSKLRPWNWKSCEAVHFIYNSIESVDFLMLPRYQPRFPRSSVVSQRLSNQRFFFCSNLRYPTQLGDKVCEPKNSKRKCSTVTLLHLGYDPHPSNSHHQDYSITFSVVDPYTVNLHLPLIFVLGGGPHPHFTNVLLGYFFNRRQRQPWSRGHRCLLHQRESTLAKRRSNIHRGIFPVDSSE